ncbi:MAG TPA: mechanosensitive ion channel [Phycisphaerae bacterium]|nr:mechanosensitive ion channel [Phycisphaerales bacterium]HRX87423.1 mechanosensitive ion channel [Phycisphaerae bacterium]
MSWTGYITYCLLVAAGGGALLWWMRQRISAAQAKRTVGLKKVRQFDAVDTESPVEDQDGEARERGLESIETRFNMMRRVLLPALSVLLLVVLVIPLLRGAPSTLLSLLVAVAAVVTGIAARPLLENLMAGVIISFSQPIRIGDTVLVDGFFGTIENISLTHTTLKVWDWRRYMVPNHHMLAKELVNYSIIDRYQWAYVEFWVSPASDLDSVRAIAIASARASRNFAGYEDPRFWVMEMGKEGIRCWIAAWADTPSAAWQLSHDIRTELTRRFRETGISTHGFEHRWRPSEPMTPPNNLAHAQH